MPPGSARFGPTWTQNPSAGADTSLNMGAERRGRSLTNPVRRLREQAAVSGPSVAPMGQRAGAYRAGPGWRCQDGGVRSHLVGTCRHDVILEAPRYLSFERLDKEELQAKHSLRRALAPLTAGSGEVLYAWYSGWKPANSDVENLALHNVDPGGGTLMSRPANRRRSARAGSTRPAPVLLESVLPPQSGRFARDHSRSTP
jgi:hypothetical protein